jgi:outer membrane protein assembly factor BamB
MLDLQAPLSGPYAWDIPHENRSSDESDRCIKAAISMVVSYYGGHLSQDRIAYHVYHEVLDYPSPQDDLGHGHGVVGVSIPQLLTWSLNGPHDVRFNGKPDFSTIVYLIDRDHPIIRDEDTPNHPITIIDGYDTDGEMVHVIDPLTGVESIVPYESVSIFVVWVVSPRADVGEVKSDEPTIWMDSDSDGVVDFDETNRFHTDPYNNDTYGFGKDDKTMIKLIYIDQTIFPTANFTCTPQVTWVNEQVTFDASGSTGNLASYEWEFGDNCTSAVTGPVVDHAYGYPGNYYVTLRVVDNNGISSATSSWIAINVHTSAPGEYEHPFYRQSLDRKGFSPGAGPETPDILWTANLTDPVMASPTVADGKVFVGTLGGRFYALDLTTGKAIWTFDAGGPVSSSAAIQNEVVFFGTGGAGRVYALNARTGLVKWLYEVPAGAAVYSSPAVVDGRVLVGSSNGDLLCLNEWGGQLLWKTHVGSANATSPAVQDGVVYVTSSRGASAVDLLTGSFLWNFDTAWPVASSLAVADGLVFLAAENDDRVFTLENSNGRLVWVYQTGGWLTSPAVDSSKQLVFVSSKDLRLYCLEEQTGYFRWRYVNGVNDASAPTVSANGLVYIGSPDGYLACVDEDTGMEIWKAQVSDFRVVSTPSVIREHALVGTQEGRIYCFGPPFPVARVHDVAVSDLATDPFEVPEGYSLQINATANNLGNTVETFDVTIYANGTAIYTQEMTLINGTSATMAFTWNTTGFARGNYTINAYAWPVPEETNTADNNFTGPVAVVVGMLGDLMPPFGVVDMKDIAFVAKHFSMNQSDPSWDPNADMNDDGKVDMKDIAIVAKHFGEHFP